jgi:hypothetical protein
MFRTNVNGGTLEVTIFSYSTYFQIFSTSIEDTQYQQYFRATLSKHPIFKTNVNGGTLEVTTYSYSQKYL